MKPVNLVFPSSNILRHLALALSAGLGLGSVQAQAPTPPPVTSGMVVWLPADGVNTGDTNQVRIVGSDTFVKQWNDFSTAANKHASNVTEADQPRYIAGALNGKPVLRFGQDTDDNGDRLYLGDLSANFPTGASLFVVATIDNDGRYNLFGNRSGNDERWVANTWNESKPGSFRTSRSGSTSFTFSDWPQTGSHVFALESNSSEFEVLINGGSIGSDTGNYNSGAGTSWTIGNRATSGQQLRGDIAEVILYNRVLNSAEANQVGTYLAQKYGLSTSYGPPSVITYLPANNTTLPPDQNLVLTFNRAITSSTGNITIKNLTDNTQMAIPIGDPQITIAGAVVTINPTADLLLGKSYAVQIDATAIKDQANVPFAGISDDTSWSFTTAGPAATTTVVSSSATPSTYGDSVTFTATVSPVPSGGTVQFYDGISSLGTAVAVNTTTGLATFATTTLGATTHAISAQYSGNFQFLPSTSPIFTQTVNKAPLTVTAQNAFRYLNTANPAPLPYQITGFKNGQTLATSGVTGTPTLTTTAILASPIGSYPITCTIGTLTAANYSFTPFVDAALNVVAVGPLAINVNFTGGTAETQSALSGPAGGLGTTWNQFAGPDSPSTLVDATGPATTVTIDTNFDLPNTFDSAVISLPMLRGSMTNFGKGVDNTNVTIGGLAPGGLYDIWLVTLRNQPFNNGTPSGTEQYVGWWSTTHVTSSASSQLVDARGTPNNTSTFVAGYNYVLFENVVANGSGNIVFTGVADPLLDGSNNSHRLGLNGLQIKAAAPVVAGPVSNATSTVTATPTSVIANGVSTSTVKVTLRDAASLPVSNKQVTLANNGGLTPPSAVTTNAQGEASFSVTSSTIATVVFTATVVADSLTLSNTASVNFTDPGAPVAFNVNFHAGTPATGLVGVVGGPSETWNQGTTSVSNLTDATGTVSSSVNVTGLPSDGYTVGAALNVFDGTRTFFGKGQDTTISITGLVPNTAYDLYIYSLSHNNASWGNSIDTERAAGDFVTTNTVQGNGQTQWLDNGKTGTNGDNFLINGNYIVFQSIVSNGTGNISVLADAYDGLNGISGDSDGDCRLHISGLQIRPASGMSVDYMNWRSASYPGLGLPNADDDGDGLNNNFEYTFGLNPTSGASASPYPSTLELGNGFFRYTRRAKSVINMDYKVWYSTNLQNWFVDNAASQIVESTGNGVEVVAVDIDPALLNENKLFVQIRTTPITGLDPEPSLVNLWGSGNTVTLLFSKPMNPSSANNPDNYTLMQDGGGSINVTNAVLSPDGGSVTLTLAAALGANTPYTVNLDRVTSATGQALGSNITRQFRTWDDNANGIKVFILAGQSNMVGYGNVETGATGAGTIGSLRYLAVNDASYPEYNYASLLSNPANTASAFRTRSDVKVWWRDGGSNLGGTIRKGDLGPPFKGSNDNYIGPEYAFGQVIGDFYPANNVLLIKCAWGGRDLAQQFRPPSAVARVPGTQVGPFFNAIINDTRDVLSNLGTQFPEWSGQGYQIVGFGWHQGFNDRINTAYSNEYKNNMPDFISDMRKVFNRPNMPFVIGSTGMDIGSPEASPYAGYSAVEKAQLWVAGVTKPAEVLSTDTRPFWRIASVSPANQGYHWNHNAESYFLVGKALGDNMVDLLTP